MPKVKTDKTWLKTIRGDVAKGCKKVEDSSIAMSVFSPPYKKKDGYTDELMNSVGRTLGRVLKPGARAFMVFGQLKDEVIPWRAAEAVAEGSGCCSDKLEIEQTIIWVKSLAIGGWMEQCPREECQTKFKIPLLQRGHYTPITPKANVLNWGFEYVFQFSKTGPESNIGIHRVDIGVPFTDKTNMTRGTRGKHGDLHCAGDVWYIPYKTVQSSAAKRHGHQFPRELARRCIVLSGISEGSVVFDPFLGGGTTAVAARLCGMNCVGYDINKDCLADSRARWKGLAGERWRLKGARVGGDE